MVKGELFVPDSRSLIIILSTSAIFLRDSVTGSTPGLGPGIEGLNPSPAANSFVGQLVQFTKSTSILSSGRGVVRGHEFIIEGGVIMKLAEALILRADCQKRLEQLKGRLLRSAKVQEGDEPAENPQDLIAEVERVAAQLLDLVQRINRTNSRTSYGDERSISDALALRDVLALRRTLYGDLAQTASVTQDRYTRSEVKYRSTINVREVQKQADDLARSYREIDARIQELNWQTEVD